MAREYDRIVLTESVPAEGLVVGDVGTVAYVYPDGKAYEVEVTTLTGTTVAVVTVESTAVRHPHHPADARAREHPADAALPERDR